MYKIFKMLTGLQYRGDWGYIELHIEWSKITEYVNK